MAAGISVIYSILWSAAYFSVVQAGFKDNQCPEFGAFKNGLAFGCFADCIIAHNKPGGTCGEGEDYNCYCNDKILPQFQHIKLLRQNCPIQCFDRKDEAKWDELCHIDCLCNHGATTCQCNYETKACDCSGKPADPTKNELCPFKSVAEMNIYANGMGLPNANFGVPLPNGTVVKPEGIIKCENQLNFLQIPVHG